LRTIVVTGGAGFIGSNFIRYMLNKHPDYLLINYDKLTYAGNLENLKDVENSPGYDFVHGDICDFNLLMKVFQGVHAVINFAAESHVDRSIVSSRPFALTNVYGTSALLEAAKNRNVSRFVQVSTDEVYGSIAKGSFKESDRLKPSSPYSASKAAADLIVRSYWTTYKMPIIITRTTNNFGPYQYPEKLISLFITNALEDRPLPLYGDGSNVRDWIYVEDNCEAIDIALHRGLVGQTYNISSGQEFSNLQISKMILKELDKSEELIEYVADRPGHDRRYSLDCQKIRELGWQPKHNFTEALRKTVDWYKENQQWWKKLKKESD
jgi:dTDP-glucose 4,6-dehydratase